MCRFYAFVNLLVALATRESKPVTRVFHRPLASEPLTLHGAVAKLETLMERHQAVSMARRLHAEDFDDVTTQFSNAWHFDSLDPVQQVNIAPGGSGEAVVTWLTQKRGSSNVVLYSSEDDEFYKQAVGQARVYTTQICLPNSAVMTHPLLGPPNGFNFSKLAALLNSSAILPKTSDAWAYIAPGQDPWDVIAKTNFCIDYKNPFAYYTSPYIHTAVLPGLKGQTKYKFKPEGSSRTFTFTTPADPGSSSQFRVGVWGDVGITNISFSVMEAMRKLQPQLLLTTGDLSYADGWPERWDVFGTMMEPLLSSVFHLAVPGNHELTQNNGIDFAYRYPMPFRQSNSESSFMFSYETGPIHVIGIEGSYAPTDRTSAQWSFVAEKLAQVNRIQTPWVIVIFHTPWYNSNKVHYQEGLKHQWDMEALLYTYGVDFVFNGHIHSYERSFPVFNYSRNDCGTVHVVIGDGGNYEGPAIYEGSPPGWVDPQPAWSAFREAAYGGGMLTVLNATHAEWEWHRVACVSLNSNRARAGEDRKYSYGGSRQSLKRTRPTTDFVWDGISGPEGGPPCATDKDMSEQRYEQSDKVTIVRDVRKCPNKAMGSGAKSDRTIFKTSMMRLKAENRAYGSQAFAWLGLVMFGSIVGACAITGYLRICRPRALYPHSWALLEEQDIASRFL